MSMSGAVRTDVVRCLTCMLSALAAPLISTAAESAADAFEAKIRPVLVQTCFQCHGDVKAGGGFRVDSREALLHGGESGPAIIPGNAADSLMFKAIKRDDSVSAMPPDKKQTLRPDQVAAFEAWINAGAVWPENTTKFEAMRHWAFEPIYSVDPPVVTDKVSSRNSIDQFIRAKQEAVHASPASTADKRTLIRRATFDLTGLPPTPAEVDAFEHDDSPQSFATVIDRLLQSPAYGERWGRHWLDVVRYADTAGETADYPVPLAWRYRNYVINAFNADKPYDEFLREQIAGDVLAGQGPPAAYAERATATGYLAISRRFGFDSENYHHLTIQDTIDTLGQSVLGLSLGCARCHDHKFDPVSMQDYYALYGIFDSSRYSFPGSEQKQRVRSMMPLLPPAESQPKWREFDARVALIADALEKQKQPVPSAILRSLNDLDGDFELQAIAAGGSNGVLVPPWLYEGAIAITNAAQSPFKNLYPRGRVGVSMAARTGKYRISQAIYPRRTSDSSSKLHLNLDFRVGPSDGALHGAHRFCVGSHPDSSTFEVLISSEAVSLRQAGKVEPLSPVKPNEWQNLQLIVDLKQRTVAGSIGIPGRVTEIAIKPCSPNWNGAIDVVSLDSFAENGVALPAIEYDNLGIQDAPIAPVSTDLPSFSNDGVDVAALSAELEALVGFDGDFEFQNKSAAPISPWGPGPNSVVAISDASQSPFRNRFRTGTRGIHMPNRGEYDGFGRTVANVKPDADGRVYAGFDFRCASRDSGGQGSWRYYFGHGPGVSAAVELFFNGENFFQRSGEARDVVSPLMIGEWYQVQLILDLNTRSYTGTLSSRSGRVAFTGQFATGWDGTLDYTFIDSYGHLGGVRPSLDADNFAISSTPLAPFDAEPIESGKTATETNRTRVTDLRRQLAAGAANLDLAKNELNTLLAEGPFPLSYGMAEGTPHNARIHHRGEPDQLGPVAPRGFIKVLGGGLLPDHASGSGRLELSHWLTNPANPLTARVMVNRIWQYHFGRGLVKTPNDFGVRGLPPTHPELLDHLAIQFVQNGWSMKALHRLIMLSATYQQASQIDSSESSPTMDMSDLYTHFVRRRLSAEEIRDAILIVSGELDPSPGREHPFPTPIGWGFSQHAPFSAVYDHNKRSVYLMTQRLKRHPFLALFDGADPNATTADRLGTTVPTQALYFLNDPFVHAKAEKCAIRLRASASNEVQQVELISRLALSRLPTDIERVEASQFLQNYRDELVTAKQDRVDERAIAAFVRTVFGSNEFLHVD